MYLGTTSNPTTLVGPNLTTMSYSPSLLNSGATYYWKVVAKDNHSNTTPGPVWSFTTALSGQNGIVTDIEGNLYNTVTIGTQVWMAENLKTTKYNDNTTIPPVTDNAAWVSLTTAGYCWYNNDEATYKATYGALYNWYAVNTGKVCPLGWHVPSDVEWKTLEMYLGMTQVDADKIKTWSRGTDQANQLKEAGTSHWASPNAGTNSTGFTSLPGGYRFPTDAAFVALTTNGIWWSSTEINANYAWYRDMQYNNGGIWRNNFQKQSGFRVRCLKNN